MPVRMKLVVVLLGAVRPRRRPRRGHEVRVIEGGANGAEPQPDILESIVDFVDMEL